MIEAPRILIHNDDTATLMRRLKAACPDARVEGCETYADMPDRLASFRPDIVYSVRFAGTTGYPRAALFGENGPHWIANGGAGTDHFGQWDPARVTVTNAAGVAADMMAEYVMGGFLHFTLDVPGLNADKRARQWAARTVRPLKGQTLLIIGLGHTGQAIAARAKAFGMRVVGTRARPEQMENVDEVHTAEALPTVLPEADFIAVSTPLIAQTRGMLGLDAFAAMKRGVVLADVSRGGVIDPAALLAAMQDGTVAGAVLDVFETEPLPSESPFWTLENAIISPHCSSVFDGWADASFDLFLTNLARWRTGQELFNVVDPARGY
ncbi:D-2-hydroxyacid dehydrogenase [uncultured Tateyamaria sp.]|uniref:D-2-hydroxyacid dehydrogenase n=1 Tax=uncultured Tateyamaria sp. TaxID=455651 RepID=UPI00261FB66F|nr:D-2-hydroxyacid dehydrogenase [uncultured Tateyamaria sp.]